METKQAIIPYALIGALAQIENIFEMRLFGFVLAKAQASLKLANPNLNDINLQFALNLVQVIIPARYLLSDGDRNYTNIRKALTLANKTIEYQRGETTYHLNIIAMPEIIRECGRLSLRFVIHNELWHALLNNFLQGYRLIHLPTFIRLRSTKAVLLYLLVSNQRNAITYSLDHLRDILGANSKAYDRTANFVARVLEPSRRELDKCAPYSFDYELKRGGRGGGYNAIELQPRRAAEPQSSDLSDEVERLRVRLDARVVEYLQSKFGMTAREVERLEDGIMALADSWGGQVERLANIFEASRRAQARNPRAYLTASLRGG